MHAIESLILLLGAAALLAQLARTLKVPYPVFLVLGGLAIGFVPGLPALELPPEVIFLVFLPPLLNYAAFFSSPRELRAHLRPITALAIGLVLFTMATIAMVAHYLIGMPWAVAFVLGAILAPTDPVAAQAVFRRLGVPGRVGTIIEGESLVNDGTGPVAYLIAVAGSRHRCVLYLGGRARLPTSWCGWVTPRTGPRLGGLTAVGTRWGFFHLHRALAAYGLRCLRRRRGGAARLGRAGRRLLRPLPRLEGSEDLPRRLYAHPEHLLLAGAGLPPGVDALCPHRPAAALHPRWSGRVLCPGGTALRRARLRDAHRGTLRLVLYRAFTQPRPRQAPAQQVSTEFVARALADGLERDAGRGLACGGAGRTHDCRWRGCVPATGPNSLPHLLCDPRYARFAGTHPRAPHKRAAPEERRRGGQGRGTRDPPGGGSRGHREARAAGRRTDSVERPGANARAIRGAHPTLRGRDRSRRHYRGVRPELRGLARLAARAHQVRAGGGTLHAGPRRGQPGGDAPR